MKKRILALILIAVMAIGLVGCKGKTEAVTLTNTMEKFSDLKTGEYTMDFSFKGTGDEFAVMPSLDVKITGVTIKEDLASMAISYKLSGETEFTTLTDMVVNGTDIYINIKALKESLTKMNNAMISPYLAYIPDGKDYLMVTQESLQTLAGSMGATASVAPTTSMEAVESYTLAATHVCKFFEDATKDVTPKAIETGDNKVTVVVNNKNASAIIDALSKSDLGAAIDAFVKEGEKIDGDKEIVDQAKENKDAMVTSVKEALTQAKTALEATTATAECKMTVGMTGSKGNRVAQCDLGVTYAQDGNSMEVSMKTVTNEKISAGKEVVVPTSIITIEELTASIMGQ